MKEREKMLGFSIYLDHDLTADDYNYLLAMRNAGLTTIFTSLNIPEDDDKLVLKRLGELTKWCSNLDIDLIADVSKAGLEKLGVAITDIDQVKKLHLTGLRIDSGVDYSTIAKLSKEMPIALNASTIEKDDVTALRSYCADFTHLQAWHNYYPRPETGLSTNWLATKNAWLHEMNLQTMAFVAGDAKKRGPINEGLPTVEQQRKENPLAAMLELKELGCDHVFIGDADLSQASLRSFKNYIKENAITLRINKDVPELFSHEWHNRRDCAEKVIRLAEGRERQLFGTTPNSEALARPKGTITCDNSLYMRYQGELQITKCDLPADKRVNVLAQVIQEDLPLLNYIEAGKKLLFTSDE